MKHARYYWRQLAEEPSDAATVWSHAGAGSHVALASRVGEPTTESDSSDERGYGRARYCKHGSKRGNCGLLSTPERHETDPRRGPREHLALQTRLTLALGGGQEYIGGRWELDNANSGGNVR